MSKESAMQLATNEAPATPGLAATPPPPTESADPSTPVTGGLDSDRFARLAAREAKLQKERETYKSEQQKFYEERDKLKSVQAQIAQFEDLKKRDPIKAFETLGFTKEDFINWAAEKDTEPTPEQKAVAVAQAEITKFKDEQAQAAAKVQQEADSRALAGFKSQIGKAVQKDTEKYEYCNFYGPVAEEIIFETVLNIVKEEPEILPHAAMQEAIDLVEAFYENEDKEMSKLKKRQGTPATETAAAAAAKPVEQLKAEVNGRTTLGERKRVMADKQVLPAKKIPSLPNNATATTASVSTKKESPSEKRARLERWLATGQKQ